MKYIFFTYKRYTYGGIQSPSVLDVLLSLFWVLIVFLILYSYRKRQENPIYKHYLPFFSFKMFVVFFFVVANSVLYGGADSAAFWNLSNSFTELLFKNSSDFFTEMFGERAMSFYKNGIGAPGWIYREQEGLFMAKITWIFTFISGKQYLLASLYFSLIGFFAQWRLYRLIMENFIENKETKLHLLFLYIPSVAFWCSGIAKDTIILICVLNLTYYILQWFVLKERKLKYIIFAILFSILMIKIRSVIFGIIIASFLLMLVFTAVNRVEQPFFRGILRVVISFVGLVFLAIIVFTLNLNETINEFLAEGEIIQQDFERNATYTGKKYSLGLTSFTPMGMLLASPQAVFTGIFRPGIWEALSASLFLNGLESIVLLYFFLKKIALKPLSFIREAFNNKLLLYSLILVLIYAFTTGFTSMIFGVLVRLRAPLLIFFAVILFWNDFVKQNNDRVIVLQDKQS